jgi:hypothetical protein
MYKIPFKIITYKTRTIDVLGALEIKWIDGILETIGNIKAEEANRRAKDRKLTQP